MNRGESMLSKEDARGLALARFASEYGPSETVIDDARTVERAYGWVFLCQSRAYMQTQDPREQMIGAPPLLVLRTGAIHRLPTNVDIARGLVELEVALRLA